VANISNILVDRLFKELKNRKVSVPKFSLATGIPTARIYKWKQEGTSPKADDEKAIHAWLNGENIEKGQEMAPVPIPGNLSLQAIKDLTETGKLREENYRVMINNESRLISLLEAKLTVYDPKDTGVASAQVMRGILVGMAKIASGTRWHSEQEAIRELGRLIDEPVLGSKKGESTQTDGGKHSTG
jgi:hypothetical protein